MALRSNYDLAPHGKHIAAILAPDENQAEGRKKSRKSHSTVRQVPAPLTRANAGTKVVRSMP